MKPATKARPLILYNTKVKHSFSDVIDSFEENYFKPSKEFISFKVLFYLFDLKLEIRPKMTYHNFNKGLKVFVVVPYLHWAQFKRDLIFTGIRQKLDLE